MIEGRSIMTTVNRCSMIGLTEQVQRLRADEFGRELFTIPAFEMLLDLYKGRSAQPRSLTSLTGASSASEMTERDTPVSFWSLERVGPPASSLSRRRSAASFAIESAACSLDSGDIVPPKVRGVFIRARGLAIPQRDFGEAPDSRADMLSPSFPNRSDRTIPPLRIRTVLVHSATASMGNIPHTAWGRHWGLLDKRTR